MSDSRELLEQISTRFADLQGEVERTRDELDAANRRLASYEQFETGLSDAIAAAIARAKEDLLPQLAALRDEIAGAEQQRAALRDEIAGLRTEREQLEASVAALRPSSAHLQSASAEALHRVVQDALGEIRAELAALARAQAPAAAPPAAAPPAATPPAATPPASPAAAPEPPAAAIVPPAPQASPVEPVAAQPAAAQEPATHEAASRPVTPEPPARTAPAGPPASAPETYEPAVEWDRGVRVSEPEPAYDGLVEDIEDPRGAPASAATAAAVYGVPEEPRQVELVLRSVRSFPQLIAIENRIQSFPGVSRVYMHRAGVDGSATLTVQLEPDLDRDGFVARLEQNERPQLLIENVSGDQIEARVG